MSISWRPAPTGILRAGCTSLTYDLTLKVPAALSVVATGDISEERVEGEWRIARHRTTAPVRVAGFNIGAYEGVKTTRGGFHLEVFANRKAETRAAATGGGGN